MQPRADQLVVALQVRLHFPVPTHTDAETRILVRPPQESGVRVVLYTYTVYELRFTQMPRIAFICTIAYGAASASSRFSELLASAVSILFACCSTIWCRNAERFVANFVRISPYSVSLA